MDSASLVEYGALIAGLAIACAAALRGWNGWLELKRLELTAGHSAEQGTDVLSPAGRISLADLKQRVRRLEAIAEGVDIPDARRSGI